MLATLPATDLVIRFSLAAWVGGTLLVVLAAPVVFGRIRSRDQAGDVFGEILRRFEAVKHVLSLALVIAVFVELERTRGFAGQSVTAGVAIFVAIATNVYLAMVVRPRLLYLRMKVGRSIPRNPEPVEEEVRSPSQLSTRVLTLGWIAAAVGLLFGLRSPKSKSSEVRSPTSRVGNRGCHQDLGVGLDFTFAIRSISTGAPSAAPRHDGRARRPVVAEAPRVDGIHGREVFGADEIHGHANDVGELETGRREDRLQIVEDALGRLLDPAADELSGRGVERDLAGSEEESAFDDRLRVGADRLRGAVGRDELHSAKSMVQGSKFKVQSSKLRQWDRALYQI